MMKRDTLMRTKRAMHKMDFHSSLQLTHALVDSHLDALDTIGELTRTIVRVQELAASFDRDAQRPGNTAAMFSMGIAAAIRNALKGEL